MTMPRRSADQISQQPIVESPWAPRELDGAEATASPAHVLQHRVASGMSIALPAVTPWSPAARLVFMVGAGAASWAVLISGFRLLF